MNTYHVTVTVSGGWVFNDIQAESEDEARETALQRANDAFENGDYDFDWDVCDVKRINPTPEE